MKLYTIGHSNHSLDELGHLLTDNQIETLVDVRTSPYSRYNPQFNKDSFIWDMPRRKIKYVYAGKKLGGHPSDPTCYKAGKTPPEDVDYLNEVDYKAIMERDWFIEGIEELLELTDQQTTAIMCSEEDPVKCHRHHLISQYINEEFPEVEIYHIRGDGIVFNARSIHKSVDKPPAEQLSLFE